MPAVERPDVRDQPSTSGRPGFVCSSKRYRASLGADGGWAALYAGQGVRLARREQPAGEIVRELMAEARGVRERLAATA